MGRPGWPFFGTVQSELFVDEYSLGPILQGDKVPLERQQILSPQPPHHLQILLRPTRRPRILPPRPPCGHHLGGFFLGWRQIEC